ncbi:spore germination cell wall hydrolase CwlJ-like protein [Inquilinus ginsengisoli]|jgi:spore germination cell wall hydrolase CwlJ-like protein|uniref:cell wall hydrolase n=1 Tax=Inquilinus ginsengisoli TaxID=363840 RepID=UPI003D20F5A5
MRRPARLTPLLAALLVLCLAPGLRAQELGEGWIMPPDETPGSLIPSRPDAPAAAEPAPTVQPSVRGRAGPAQIRRLIVSRLRLADARQRPQVLRQARCLAYAVYFETQGETRLGQLAVAQVVLNRLRSPAYPKTVCRVVADRGQFPWTTGDLTIRDAARFRIAWSVALHMMAGIFTDPTQGATHFYAPARVGAPAWATPEAYLLTIGGHRFFRP